MEGIIKMVAGNKIDVKIQEVWPSIAKVIHLARLATADAEPEMKKVRLAFLQERLDDLKDYTFNPDNIPNCGE